MSAVAERETAMNRQLITCLLMVSLAALSGCAMCVSSLDSSYSAYGGAWQRIMPNHGRVGSVFDPAGGQAVGADGAVVHADGALETEDAGTTVLTKPDEEQAPPEESSEAPSVPAELMNAP